MGIKNSIVEKINQWNGTTNDEIECALRNKTYECFNGLIQNLSKELSKVVNDTTIKQERQKIMVIRAILQKYNLYDSKK